MGSLLPHDDGSEARHLGSHVTSVAASYCGPGVAGNCSGRFPEVESSVPVRRRASRAPPPSAAPRAASLEGQLCVNNHNNGSRNAQLLVSPPRALAWLPPTGVSSRPPASANERLAANSEGAAWNKIGTWWLWCGVVVVWWCGVVWCGVVVVVVLSCP